MTVDDRLRAAHARIPEPDTASIARARARLTAALEGAPDASPAPRGEADTPPARGGEAGAHASPALGGDTDISWRGTAPEPGGRAPLVRPRRRRRFAIALPLVALAAAAAAVIALVSSGDGARREREAVPPVAGTPAAVGGPVAYERNTFAVSIRYIAADGSTTASAANAAYGIARSVPEEIWRAPDGSGRIAYGADSAPYLPSAADERAWRAAGSPDLEKLAGDPGRWGPKQQTFGPGELDAALLLNSNLEAVLPKRDPLSVVPHDPTELAAWLNAAAARQRPNAPDRVVGDAVVSDALTFLRDARAPHDLRVALIDVLSRLAGARSLAKISDAAGREWPGIELADGTVVAYDPDACRLMARGVKYEDGVRWTMTYSVASAGVAMIGDRP